MTEIAYQRPRTLAEGLEYLAEHPSTVVAGATDVYPAQATRRVWEGSRATRGWLDISAMGELEGIAAHTDHTRVGSLVTWSELVRSPLPPVFDGLKAAAREVGGVQIQNRATLVGNVCNASPAADGVPPLLTLDASVEMQSDRGCRTLPLGEFIQGNRQTALGADELVTALLIPRMPGHARGAFHKLGARRYLVISIVMVAGVVCVDEAGAIETIRLAVGACSPVARRLVSLEARLTGQTLTPDLVDRVEAADFEGLAPIDDVRADAAYRRHAAVELTTRVLRDLCAGPVDPGAHDEDLIG